MLLVFDTSLYLKIKWRKSVEVQRSTSVTDTFFMTLKKPALELPESCINAHGSEEDLAKESLLKNSNNKPRYSRGQETVHPRHYRGYFEIWASSRAHGGHLCSDHRSQWGHSDNVFQSARPGGAARTLDGAVECFKPSGSLWVHRSWVTLLITLDKCATHYPVSYRSKSTKCMTIAAVVSIWFIGALINTFSQIWWDDLWFRLCCRSLQVILCVQQRDQHHSATDRGAGTHGQHVSDVQAPLAGGLPAAEGCRCRRATLAKRGCRYVGRKWSGKCHGADQQSKRSAYASGQSGALSAHRGHGDDILVKQTKKTVTCLWLMLGILVTCWLPHAVVTWVNSRCWCLDTWGALTATSWFFCLTTQSTQSCTD
ncbi:hypothetical protein Btru_059767 [Bulinus truncatus]|nr:hypothetical protein Btru_059767 [Bulinus truncatus]